MLIRLLTTIQPMKYGAVCGEKSDRITARCSTCDWNVSDLMCKGESYDKAEAHVAETGHWVEAVEYKGDGEDD